MKDCSKIYLKKRKTFFVKKNYSILWYTVALTMFLFIISRITYTFDLHLVAFHEAQTIFLSLLRVTHNSYSLPPSQLE